MERIERKTALLASAVLLLLSAAGCQTTGAFEYIPGPDSSARPFTKAPAAASGQPLRFAIVSDRTGGHRPGVFEDAVGKLNLLQPDLVLCVGDLVEGYTRDPNVIHAMWDEFGGIIAPLSMPFFHVRGNHDSLYPELDQVWRQRIGPRHYAFVYRDCLFLCLNSLDGNLVDSQWQPGISREQTQWVRKVLAEHPRVRWTFAFMHYPLWLFDEDASAKAQPGEAPKLTGFAKLEETLAGRRYTVFVGHYHQYAKYVRYGQDYYVLATTGGGSSLRGGPAGEFDEIAWISMTPKGPAIANLELKGILPDDVRTSLQEDLSRWKVEKTEMDPLRITLVQQGRNVLSKPVSVSAAWSVPEGSAWSVQPRTAAIRIEPNQSGRISAVATFSGAPSAVFPLPSCDAQCGLVGQDPAKMPSFPLPPRVLQSYFVRNRPTVSCPRAAAPPKCDGSLDDPVWQGAPLAASFTNRLTGRKSLTATEGRLAYDKDNLYVAFRCQEPNMTASQATAKGLDADLADDDIVGLFTAPAADRKTYYRFAANAGGAALDSKGPDAKWNSGFKAAAGVDANGWSVEMAIPWKALGISSPKAGDHVAVLLMRWRMHTFESLQWPLSPIGHDQPAAYAEVILGE